MQDPYADCVGLNPSAIQVRATVVEQTRLAKETYQVRLHAPEVARQIVPGQFFMLRDPRHTDPLLGRPFALYDVRLDDRGEAQNVDFVYHVIGKFTRQMAHWRGGEEVELWGPLGNGFPTLECACAAMTHADAPLELICVGGGIGYTPFLAVAREALGKRTYGERRSRRVCHRMRLLYGTRSADFVADLSEFREIPGVSVEVSTDDGSLGHHGLVTELLDRALNDPASSKLAYCCGPEPMMHAVAMMCKSHGVACWLSLESPMACGFGVCFSCVTRVKTSDERGWDYRRTCVEGPVFPAAVLHWE